MAAGWPPRTHNPEVAGSNPAPATTAPATNRAAFRGGPICSTGCSTGRLPVEASCGLDVIDLLDLLDLLDI